MNLISTYITDLKNVMFPDICPGCNENVLPRGRLFCTDCLLELPFTDHFDVKENRVIAHFYGRIPLRAAASLVYFSSHGNVQEVMHRFKYKGHKNVGITFGHIAGEKILLSPHFYDTNAIIPVPLHKDKEYIRGYNQSTVFANGISEISKIPVYHDVLVKTSKNESQTGKNRMERVKNVGSVYELRHPEKITGKNIVLVDDVITTGATLEACCDLLIQAKPAGISIITIACAI
ncbi:MAG: ComF family protein [Saprospiraceae bacterium]|nr:ComF family protein [Saprospiraceae bacterium]